MSASTMAQAYQILDLVRDKNRRKVQRLIDNADLLEILMQQDPGGVDREQFKQLIKGPAATGSFGLFPSISEQWHLICLYNEQYWGGYFSERELRAYQPGLRDYMQSTRNLHTFHVQFDSLEETVEMWWKVFQGEQPRCWQMETLKLDSRHLRLLSGSVATYQPKSITEVRIDLTANWGLPLEKVRKRAKSSGATLAQAEVMSAYGLHSALFRKQSGDIVPRPYMAGTDVIIPGDPGETDLLALCIGWDPTTDVAKLHAGRFGYTEFNGTWSAPVILES